MVNQDGGWRREFGLEWGVPPEVDALVDNGVLVDDSWHNDASPMFVLRGTQASYLVYVDSVDPSRQADREGRDRYPDHRRFTACLEDENGQPTYPNLLETDDLQELLTFVADRHGA